MQAYEQGSEDDEQFVQNLALFLTSFLREHLQLIEGAERLRQQLTTALTYLVKISYVQNSGAPLRAQTGSSAKLHFLPHPCCQHIRRLRRLRAHWLN